MNTTVCRRCVPRLFLVWIGLTLLVGCGDSAAESSSSNTSADHAAAEPLVYTAEFNGEDWNSVGVNFKEPAAATVEADPQIAELAKNRRELRQFVGHSGRITGVAFSPDGRNAISSGDDGTVRWWDAETGKELRRFEDGLASKPTCVAVSPDGRTAVAGCRDGAIHVWNTADQKHIKTLTEHQAPVYYLTISPRGTRMISTDESGVVLTWSLDNWQCEQTQMSFGFEGQRYYPVFDPTEDYLLASVDSRQIVRWRLSDGRYVRPLPFQSVLPNARLLQMAKGTVVAANRRTLIFLRVNASNQYEVSQPQRSSLDRIIQVAPIPSMGLVAAVGGAGAVEYWRPVFEESAGRYPAPANGVTAAALRPRYAQSLSGFEDGSLVLWQLPAPRSTAEENEVVAMSNLAVLLHSERFDRLEEIADGFRKNPRERDTHNSELAVFYEALARPADAGRDWNKHFALIERWRASKPHSITPQIAEAKSLISQGWEARGTGYANTVTRQGGQVFGDRFKRAMDVLKATSTLPEKDPELYLLVLQAQRGLGLPREAADEAFRRGQSIDPYYSLLYSEMANYLLPRWSGAPGELATWAAKVCDALPQRGDEFYARVACDLMQFSELDFEAELGMDLPRIRRGLAQMKPDYRESRWLLNCGAMFACLDGDDPAAHEHFQRIGKFFHPTIWRGAGRYDDFVRRADPARVRGQEKMTLMESGWQLRSMAHTPDGKYLLTVTSDPRLPFKIWDLASGKVVRRLPGDEATPRDGVFHPRMPNVLIVASGFLPSSTRDSQGDPLDERARATAGGIMVWNLLRPDEETRMLYSGGVRRLSISQDSRLLAASCMDKKVRVWNLLSDEPPLEFSLSDSANDLAISSDGKRLATQTQHDVQIWDVAAGANGRHVGGEVPVGVTSGRRNLRFSADGSLLTFNTNDGRLVLWDVEKQELRHVLSLQPGANLYQAALSPNGRLLATGDDKYSVRLWDVITAKQLHEFEGHHVMFAAIEFLPDGKTIVSSTYDGTIKFWDVSKWAQ